MGSFVAAGLACAGLIFPPARGRQSLAEVWPWLLGELVFFWALSILLRRLADNGESSDAVTAGPGEPGTGPGMEMTEVEQLVKSGKRIEAVALVRRLTGRSLKDSLAIVKALEKKGAAPE
ncbi:hypothetical protein ABZS66_17810 [Dactylosporangium sp. NPDC005572]|uniref:hypothetical protein n=1 Tax=Dactylosporangium sp. NPDC005572 TaxID=3156889 RepID=UPI0033B7E4F1